MRSDTMDSTSDTSIWPPAHALSALWSTRQYHRRAMSEHIRVWFTGRRDPVKVEDQLARDDDGCGIRKRRRGDLGDPIVKPPSIVE